MYRFSSFFLKFKLGLLAKSVFFLMSSNLEFDFTFTS